MQARMFLAILVLAACQREPASQKLDAVADLAVTDTSVPADAPADLATCTDTHACRLQRVQAALAADDAERLRFIVHLHSAYSKDGCDSQGLDANGQPNAACVANLRAGLCASGLDVAFLTDHPSHMKDHPFEALLYHDGLGDTLLRDAQDRPYGNVLHCPAQDGQPARDVAVSVGYEGDHMMPVGLHGHLASKDRYQIKMDDKQPLADVQSVVAEVHALGGLVVNAHSEQLTVTAKRLADSGADAMEIYNIHANVFASLLAVPANVFRMEPFLQPKGQAAHPDLALLPILAEWPEPAFAKWREVLRTRRITAVVGSDAHENVQLPRLCGQDGLIEDTCAEHAQKAPHAVKAFSQAGPFLLADGVRFDSYRRMLRWYSARALVQPGPAPALDRVQAAVAASATYNVWNLFGEPTDVHLVAARQAGEQPLAATLGGTAKAAVGALLLAFRLPGVQAEPWSPFTTAEAEKAPREARLWRVTADGSAVVATWDGQTATGGLQTDASGAAWLAEPPPGRYFLEVQIKPVHLAPALQAAGELAQAWYRWVVTNPVEVL